MNSFETDLRRAVCSAGFLAALALQLGVLFAQGAESTLFRMTVPVACTLPFSCGFPEEYRGGFARLALVRTSVRGYILGKFAAACLSGGGVEVLAAWAYDRLSAREEPCCTYSLLFLSAMLWAGTAALLAAVSDSRCLAYGGPFVLCYFLVILAERYWKASYCLYPDEWLFPRHAWPFGETGICLLLGTLLVGVGLAYFAVVERKLEHV